MHPDNYKKDQKGNFYIDNKSVDIRGRNKSFKQIKDINDSFLAIDNIEAGIGNKISLWRLDHSTMTRNLTIKSGLFPLLAPLNTPFGLIRMADTELSYPLTSGTGT